MFEYYFCESPINLKLTIVCVDLKFIQCLIIIFHVNSILCWY